MKLKSSTMHPTLIWLLETSEIQQNRWKTERGKKIPKKINADSPFVRHKREEVHKGGINRICAKDRKDNFTQTRSYLAGKQLYTHCLNPLLKLSSLPCYLRGWRSLYLEQKRKYVYVLCMYVCVESCLQISLRRIISMHINSEGCHFSWPHT